MDRKDFKLESNILTIKNNDLVIGQSDQQHISDLINSHLGWYREFPLVGASASDYINSPASDIPKFESAIKESLKSDGYQQKIRVNEFTSESQDIVIYE
jgi:hypothetical protein